MNRSTISVSTDTTSCNALALCGCTPNCFLGATATAVSATTATNARALCGCVPTCFLGATATANNSTCLNGQLASYYSVSTHVHGSINAGGCIGTASGCLVCTTTSGCMATITPSSLTAGCASTAGNALALCGCVPACFLGATATATCATTAGNALALCGCVPSCFLGATATANNSNCIAGLTCDHLVYGGLNTGTNNMCEVFNVYCLPMRKSGFWDVSGANWTPTTDWYWGITSSHSGNGLAYNYGMQLIGRGTGGGDNNNFYLRTISNGTPASWRRIYTDGDSITAACATNADTVDGQHFSWSNQSNSPDYVWGTCSNGSNWLASTAQLTVRDSACLGGCAASNYIKTDSQWLNSPRDFANGAIIETNIDYSQSSGDAFLIQIKGNSYTGGLPFDVTIQGYIYSNTIINATAISHGTSLGTVSAINYNGHLTFYIPRISYWNGFRVWASAVTGEGRDTNRVISITNGAKPTTAKEYVFTITSTINSGNIGSQSVSYANTAGSAPANGGTSSYSTYLWSTTHGGSWYMYNCWSGTYWCLKSNHSSPVAAGYADSAGSAANINGVATSTCLCAPVVRASTKMYAPDFQLESDLRSKTNIEPIKIAPINIEYKKFNLCCFPDKTRYGVIAQELQVENPELVNSDENGKLSVSYIDLLVKEVAYLKCKVAELERRLG